MTWRSGTIVSTGRTWDGAQELVVDLDDTPATPPLTPRVRALAYPDLVGPTEPGDTVVLNTTALDRGLGTGGYALVITVHPAAGPRSPVVVNGPGHLVKARYTPLQTMVLGVDEQESPYHATLADADSIEGMPVVVADLHSALPAIIAGARHHAEVMGRPAPRIAYVMTDGGALPAWFSRTIAGLRAADWIQTCITVGQAFGGDLDAVTVHTGLLAAHHVTGADLTVVAQGPGNLGTGTRWGFSGVAAGEAINATAVLAGTAIASLRLSCADPRPRHQGISHHSLTAYERVALRPADVVLPILARTPGPFEALGLDPDALDSTVRRQARVLADVGHTLIEVPTTNGLLDALVGSPVALSTMGRNLDEDPAAFLAAAVAGVHAVNRLR